jgi:hypothetical protein
MIHQTPAAASGLRFPDILTFRDWFTPVRIAADIVDLDVEGSIPPGLDGAFCRLAPTRKTRRCMATTSTSTAMAC